MGRRFRRRVGSRLRRRLGGAAVRWFWGAGRIVKVIVEKHILVGLVALLFLFAKPFVLPQFGQGQEISRLLLPLLLPQGRVVPGGGGLVVARAARRQSLGQGRLYRTSTARRVLLASRFAHFHPPHTGRARGWQSSHQQGTEQQPKRDTDAHDG
jgi:hypothetical protein